MSLFLLRVGLALVFLYAAVAAALDPFSWIGFLPQWLRRIFPAGFLLAGFSVYQSLLGFWLISRFKIFYAAIFASATIFAIVVFNLGALDIVFRDIAILFMALALVFLSWQKKRRIGKRKSNKKTA